MAKQHNQGESNTTKNLLKKRVSFSGLNIDLYLDPSLLEMMP